MSTVTCDFEELVDLLDRVYSKGLDKLDSINKEAMKYGMGQALTKASQIIEENFKQIVQRDFYDAYQPRYYNNRAYDIGNVLKTEASMSDLTLTLTFDPDSMNQYERQASGTLMDLTLGEGYHGGAFSYTKHDLSGEYVHYPHYRYPVDNWCFWGQAAVQTESPYDIFVKWLTEYWEGPGFANDCLPEYYNKLHELASNILSL